MRNAVSLLKKKLYKRKIMRRKLVLSPYFIVSEAGKRGEKVERFRFANQNFPAIMAILERPQRKAPSQIGNRKNRS